MVQCLFQSWEDHFNKANRRNRFAMQITSRSLQPCNTPPSRPYLLYPGYVTPMWCHSASAYEKSTLLHFCTPVHLTPSTLVVITESPTHSPPPPPPRTKIFLCIHSPLPGTLFLKIILKYGGVLYGMEEYMKEISSGKNVWAFLKLPIWWSKPEL
jgi:hypothetical protein